MLTINLEVEVTLISSLEHYAPAILLSCCRLYCRVNSAIVTQCMGPLWDQYTVLKSMWDMWMVYFQHHSKKSRHCLNMRVVLVDPFPFKTNQMKQLYSLSFTLNSNQLSVWPQYIHYLDYICGKCREYTTDALQTNTAWDGWRAHM